MARSTHRERHRSERVGRQRDAVLGASGGIVSTASMVAAWRRCKRCVLAHRLRAAVLSQAQSWTQRRCWPANPFADRSPK